MFLLIKGLLSGGPASVLLTIPGFYEIEILCIHPDKVGSRSL